MHLSSSAAGRGASAQHAACQSASVPDTNSLQRGPNPQLQPLKTSRQSSAVAK